MAHGYKSGYVSIEGKRDGGGLKTFYNGAAIVRGYSAMCAGEGG